MLEKIKSQTNSEKDLIFAEKHLLPHSDLIYRCAFRLAKNQSDAEDLTQDTYLIALKNYDQINDLSKCKNWLFSILRNLFLKDINKKKKHQVVDYDAVSNFIYELTNLSDDLLLQELKTKVRGVLDMTEPRHRLPIELFYFKKLSYIEIAKELNLPIGTVMSRIARAKIYLRKELEEFYSSEND